MPGVTDAGLPFLAGLPRLQEVHLEGLPGVTLEEHECFRRACACIIRPDAAPLDGLLGFGWRRSKAAAETNALAELIAFLGRHPLPALVHFPAKTGAIEAVTTMTSEQNAAERQQSQRLP